MSCRGIKDSQGLLRPEPPGGFNGLRAWSEAASNLGMKPLDIFFTDPSYGTHPTRPRPPARPPTHPPKWKVLPTSLARSFPRFCGGRVGPSSHRPSPESLKKRFV